MSSERRTEKVERRLNDIENRLVRDLRRRNARLAALEESVAKLREQLKKRPASG